MYAIVNGKIIDGHTIIKDHSIIINNNIIVQVIPNEEVPSVCEKLDVDGAFISSGFIDLQINGCSGILFDQEISEEALYTMYKANILSGCTSFLPTLITSPKTTIEKALEVVTTVYNKIPNNVLGIHIEGPYINKTKKGIHNEDYIRSINEEEALILRKAATNLPILLTLAPEVNDLGLVNSLLQSGVIVSLGHSNATYEQAMEAIDLGVNCATHLYNAMSPLHHRNPGLVAAILNSPQVAAGIILDGFHVDFNLLGLTKKIKQEGLYIVTDAIWSVVPGKLNKFQFGGQELTVTNNKATNKNGVIGGSVINMIDSIRNAVEKLGLGLVEAVRMSTLYPAKIMKCHNRLGLIKHGYIANLAIFDCDFNMQYTVSNGEVIKVC